MSPDDIRFLASDAGRALLGRARETRALAPHQRPAALRADAGDGADAGAWARLALQQDDLRVRAAGKLPFAETLLYEAAALEQATPWAIAAERAARWPGAPGDALTDLTAGLGVDAFAAARAGRPVRAIERDPVRAALLEANAAALGLSDQMEVVAGDATTLPATTPLAFLDPDRRPDGVRTRDAEQFAPPASSWPELLGAYRASQVKLAPGTPPEALAGRPFEVVSLAGRARETRVFLGSWDARPPRRALALPRGAAVAGDGLPWPRAADVEVGAWLFDPDVAVVLADLVGDLAQQEGLAPVHPRIAYLVGPARTPTEAGTWMRVETVLPPKAKPIQAWLAAREIGNLTIRARGIKEPVEAWRKRLRPAGPNAGTLVLTRRRDDRWVAYGCAE
ncbi:MAG: SAM-dependent methyltransferase [Planctomycetota bacterium]|nr:SAM-dependent methyltransferase [Planctomycetota bacterium]